MKDDVRPSGAPVLDDPLTLLSAHPALVLLALFGAAALEYIFPPFWGDTFMLAGCFLAGTDRAAPLGVLAACIVGSCFGAAAAYGLGRHLGRPSLNLMGTSRRVGRLAERMERLFARYGSRVLAFNRFLPGVRGLSVPLAGVGRMPFRRVLLWSSVSNVLYCSVLLAVGLAIGAADPDFAAFQGTMRHAVGIAAAVAAVGLALALAWRWSAGRRRSEAA